MRPMSERREMHRANFALSPSFDSAWSWLRTELADLERRCARSCVLSARSALTRRRVRRQACAVLLDCTARMDALVPLPHDEREVRRRAAREAEFRGSRTDDERMWRANAWALSSEKALGGERIELDEVRSLVAAMAERIARAGRGSLGVRDD